MAAGTGGHIIPGLAVAARCAARLERQLARHARAAWRTGWCRRRHRARRDRLRRPARQGPDAHDDRRRAPAARRSGTASRILRARGADAVLGMGGYVCFPGGLMASLLGKPLVLVNADASLLLSNKRAAAGGRPGGLRLRRAAATQTQARRGHRQPGARRDRGAARAGAALRRPQRPAAAAGGRRQPGRARCSTTRCRRRWRCCRRTQRPHVTHQTGALHIDAVRAAYARRRRRGRGAAVHRRHGGAPTPRATWWSAAPAR